MAPPISPVVPLDPAPELLDRTSSLLGVEAAPDHSAWGPGRLALGLLLEGLGDELGETLEGGLAVGFSGAVAL